MPEYGDDEYWNERYAKFPDHFDWYVNWEEMLACKELSHILNEPKKYKRVLLTGIGNSLQGEQMAKAGFEVYAIDISSVVIEKMKSIGQEGVAYMEMDIQKLSFSEGDIDLVIDKGTLDSILCGKSSTDGAKAMINEIYRVLRPGGAFVCVSHGRSDARIIHIKQEGTEWDVEHVTVNKLDVDENTDWASTSYHCFVSFKPGGEEASTPKSETLPESSAQNLAVDSSNEEVVEDKGKGEEMVHNEMETDGVPRRRSRGYVTADNPFGQGEG